MDYSQLSKEDQERHDKFCLDITRALNGLQDAADGIVEMLDATTEAFDKETKEDNVHSIRL